MIHSCLNCDHLFRVMGTTICDTDNQIISYPNETGRFCPRWKEKDGNANTPQEEEIHAQ